MKTSTLLIIGGIAVAAYFVYNKSKAATPATTQNTNPSATQGLGGSIGQATGAVGALNGLWTALNNFGGHQATSGPTNQTTTGAAPPGTTSTASPPLDPADTDYSGGDDSYDYGYA